MTERHSAATDGHVADAVGSMFPGDIVTRYLLVAETIDHDSGQRTVVTIADDNGTPWDAYALARMAIAKADALIARQDADDD